MEITMKAANRILAALAVASAAAFGASEDHPVATMAIRHAAEAPFYMIRFTEAAHGIRSADTRTVLRINAEHPGSADACWFCPSMWNTLAETQAEFGRIAAFRGDCAKAGVALDTQMCTLGHGSIYSVAGTVPKELHPFTDEAWQRDEKGELLRMLCPRAPETLAYAERYFAALGKTVKPGMAWLDDDLRLGFSRANGCFCDRCITAFNAEYKHALTRDELVKRLFGTRGKDPIRREWLSFLADSLAVYGAAARKGVDGTHPACIFGYQSVSSASLATGRDYFPLLKSFTSGGRVPAAIRIGSGCYNENVDELVAKSLDVAREAERCRASGIDLRQICYEQESYQREILHKSVEAMLVESAVALAAGCDSLSEYRYGSRVEPLSDYAEFAAKMAAWRPHLKRIAAFSKTTTLGGVARFVGSDYDLTARYGVADGNDALLSGLGVPVSVRESGTRDFYVDALTLEEWGAGDAAKLLANGGRAIVSAEVYEKFLKLDAVLAEAAKEGRIVPLDFTVLRPRDWSALPTTAERKTLLDALDKASAGTFSVRIDRAHRFHVYPRVNRADGKVAAVTLYNGSVGASPATEVCVRRPAGTYPVLLRPETADLPLYVIAQDAREIRFAVPALPGRQVGTVVFGTSCPDTAAEIAHVNGERAVLPKYREGGNWGAGYRFAATKMWEVSACDALIVNSVRVVAADGRLLQAGADYRVEPHWAAIGLVGAAATDATVNPVTLSYAYRTERLDAWFANAEGQVDVRRGTSVAFNPKPPEIPDGATRLANCWTRGVGRYDHGRFFRVEGPFAAPEPPVSAEAAMPKTLAKLRRGEKVRVLAWGDSVTEASYLPDDERWQNRIADWLRAKFPQARVELVSLGWGGRRITDFLSEPPGSQFNYAEKVLASGADLVISEFVNDSWLSSAEVTNHYGRVLADFRAHGIEWVILTPHYMMPSWCGLKGCADCDEDPREYVKALRSFAAQNGVGLADAAAHWGHLWREGIPYVTRFVNGVNHPDREGMGYFVEAFRECLESD